MTATLAPGATTAAPAGTRNPVRWLVFAVVVIANVMDLMDATIVNIAGPSIRAELGGSDSVLQWLSAGYTLAFAIFLITGARLGDMVGRRRMFLIGSAGFTLMSAVCAAAPNVAVLIVCRILQGAFGAALIPQGIALLKEAFDDDEMPKVFAFFGPMMALSGLVAPLLAGVLVEADLWSTGWRLVFLINVPIGVAGFLGALKVLPRTVSHPGMKLDVVGMVLVGGALTAIIYPLIQGQPEGWPAWTFVMLGVGVALLVAFALWERRRTSDPLIERTLLGNRTYISGLLVLLSFGGAFGGLILCVGLFAQLGMGFSPVHAGLTLMAMIGGMMAGMFGSMSLTARLGRHLLHIGFALIAAGTVVLAVTVTGELTVSTLALSPGLFLIGVGAGFAAGPMFDFIIASVGVHEVGSASGVLEAVQQLGTAVGVAALGTIFFSAFGEHSATHSTHALAVTAWACLVPVAAAFLLVFRLPMRSRELAE